MAKKATKKTPETRIYIGPTLLGLPQYMVFKNGQKPLHVEQMINDNPSIANLIVPITGLQEARKNMQTKGHILNRYASQLLKNKRSN